MRRSSFVYLTFASSLALPLISDVKADTNTSPFSGGNLATSGLSGSSSTGGSISINNSTSATSSSTSSSSINTSASLTPSATIAPTSVNITPASNIIITPSTLSPQSVSLSTINGGAAGEIREIGTLNNGTASWLYDVSDNGLVAIGTSYDGSANNAMRTFRWTAEGGAQSIGTLQGYTHVNAVAISGDGNTLVGEVHNKQNGSINPQYQAYRWTQSTGLVGLGYLTGYTDSYAADVNQNGQIIVGSGSGGNQSSDSQAFRWTEQTGMVGLGFLNNGKNSDAYSISGDGRVIVGNADDGSTGKSVAFRWTEAEGMKSLGQLGNSRDIAWAVSNDGSVIVGQSDFYNNNVFSRGSFRWTAATGMTNLGVLNGGNSSVATDVSGNGLVIVGTANDGADNNAYRAYRWTNETGMQTVEKWLSENGVQVDSGLKTDIAYATNTDGSVVVGQLANKHGFLARVNNSYGNGLIDTANYASSLQASAAIPVLGLRDADLTINGAHGNPMRGLLSDGRHNAWLGGDWGRSDYRQMDGQAAVGELGYGYGLAGATLKMAVGRSYSDQASVWGGGTTIDGTYLMPEVITPIASSPLHLSLSGYYNFGDAVIRRGYLNAGTQAISRGQADADTAAGRIRLDWLNAFSLPLTQFTPYASYSFTRTRVGGYTETGGGFPARWQARSEQGTQARVGLDAVINLDDNFNLLARLEGVHRFEAQGTTSQVEVLGLNQYSFAGQSYRQYWLRGMVGGEAHVGPGVATATINATSESETPNYWVAASYRLTF